MSNKAQKRGLIPKLRFPEFREVAGWKAVTLQEASAPVTERVGQRKLTPVSISAGIGFVPQAEKFGRDISGNQYQLYTLVSDGDFVYNKGNSLKFPQGCVYLLQGWGQVAAPNVFICFRLKDGYSNGFLQNCFEQNMHGKQLKKHITSGARSNGLLNISKENFFNVEIPTPSPAEQKRIADCLATLDERITLEAQKLDTLKTHKKGLMQQLFPAEGETLPKLRFPEFRETGTWSKEKLGAVATLYKGKGISKAEIVANGVQPCIRYGELYTIYGETIHETVSSTNVDASELFLSKKNDVIIPASGETKIDIAKASCVMSDDIALGSDLNVIRSSQNGIFLSYQLNGPLRLSIAKVAQGDTVVHLYPTQIERLDVLVPSPIEQQKIADCLASLDDLITAQIQQLTALKTHKKGLMQQLFPVLEEVPT